MSHVSRLVVGSYIGPAISRPDRKIVELISTADVTVISELVGPMYTLDDSIHAVAGPAIAVTGTAVTAKCPPGDNLAMVRALSEIKPGDVLVVDAKGFSHWCLGGFQLIDHARNRSGLAGMVINGAYRDVEDVRAAGFPLYATGIAPYSGPKAGPGEVNVPVACGGVVIHPGDIICASGEGIAVVPKRAIDKVAEFLSASLKVAGKEPSNNVASLVSELGDVFDANLHNGTGD